MRNIINPRNIFVLCVLIFAASTRIIKHPDNFTAIGAMGLFAGAVMSSRAMSLLASFAVMFATDAMLGFYEGFWIVYIAFALSIVTGWIISKKQNVGSITIASLISALLFFIISNFGVWTGPMYAHTYAGFMQCYSAALPFFWNGLASQFVYGAILFGGYHLLRVYKPTLIRVK
ncbi:MAG TPA: DUF6580 family putative transport protein [Bacteroidia bacterium]|jgi:hypothetical protein|nr:DUF6580 family putative transport protein [Bacteroidia bacterium]